MWAYLSRDRIVWVAVALETTLVLLYAYGPPRNPDSLVDMATIANLLLLLLVVLGARRTAGLSESVQERRFWRLLLAAFSSWLILETIMVAVPAVWDLPGAWVGIDVIYLIFYGLAFLAAEERPDLLPGPSVVGIDQGLVRRCAVLALCISFLVYFVVIPGTYSWDSYATGLPSALLYTWLDLFLAARFLYLAHHTRRRRWRAVHLLLGFSLLLWAVVDSADAVGYLEEIDVGWGTQMDLYWFLPFLLAIIAVRLRSFRGSDEERAAGVESASEAGRRPLGVHAFVLALSLPAVHLAGYSFGALDQASRAPREVIVLGFLVTMVALGVFGRALDRANDRLHQQAQRSQRLTSLGRLAGGVAHDFNNLLQVIVGQSELLQTALGPQHSEGPRVGELLKASRRAADLTRQLLIFSQNQVFMPQPLDVNEVVADTVSLLDRLVGETVELRTRLEPGLDPILADRTQMEQVVTNLVINSRDALPAGGEIEISSERVRVETAQPGYQRSSPPGEYVRLTVRDNGVGISERDLEHVFEPFFTTKDMAVGTGLGLATVFGVATQSGGYIRIDSTPQRGTTVEIDFPPCPRSPVAAVIPPSLREGHGERLLVVEDDPAVREVVRDVLVDAGYGVEVASGGRSALELMDGGGSTFDLLITDVSMPGLSGPELAERVLASSPSMPVLFMSGYPRDSSAGHCKIGSDDPYLQKPFSPGALTTAVRELLDSSQG